MSFGVRFAKIANLSSAARLTNVIWVFRSSDCGTMSGILKVRGQAARGEDNEAKLGFLPFHTSLLKLACY